MGIDHDSGGLLLNTEYEFRVSATATINGQTQTIESAPLRTTTFGDMVFAAPEAIKLNGSEDIDPPVPFENYNQYVFNSANVRLGDVSWGREKFANRGRYKFALHVPKGTGVQIGGTGALSQHSECSWGAWPSKTLSGWVSWRWRVQLVKCGIGDGTSAITVKIRNYVTQQDYHEWDAATIRVRKAWHDANHSFRYQIGCMPAPTSTLDYNAAIEAGASGWPSDSIGPAGSKLTFWKVNLTGCALNDEQGRVSVKHYSLSSNNAQETCSDPHYLACAVPVASSQPHITTQKILINKGDHPNRGFTWQSIPDASGHIPQGHYYLPYVMMHEFGHVAGLGHSANGSDIMYYPASKGKIINTPTANDILAMQAIYNSHAAH